MQNSAPIPLTGMGVFGSTQTMSRMNAAAITMTGIEFRRVLNAVLVTDEIISTTSSTMNSEDSDELVCSSESEESGSTVASVDAGLHTIESARLDATNCNEVLSTI